VLDLVSDPRWVGLGWRTLALEHGLKSVRSTPILSLTGKVLGTFAIYEREPGPPTALLRDLIARFTHVASIAIFAQSSSTRGSGIYTTEFKLDERTTFLRWVGTMDGHKIESLEVIVDNEQGLIVERTIALRPFPAVKLFRDAMYASLKDKLPPDVWDYPTP
jgi:hypothetical protein